MRAKSDFYHSQNRKLRQQIDDNEKALYNRRPRQREEFNSTGSSSSNDDSGQSNWEIGLFCNIFDFFKGMR